MNSIPLHHSPVTTHAFFGLSLGPGRDIISSRQPRCELGTQLMKMGKIQVIGNLGMGANSSILHIRRSNDSRQYALKVVPIGGAEDLKFLTQARHEYRVSRMLDHPNLIKIF